MQNWNGSVFCDYYGFEMRTLLELNCTVPGSIPDSRREPVHKSTTTELLEPVVPAHDDCVGFASTSSSCLFDSNNIGTIAKRPNTHDSLSLLRSIRKQPSTDLAEEVVLHHRQSEGKG